MNFLLTLSRHIDAMNGWFGKIANAMILLSCLVSAGNALLRYGFDISDNWPLELQWYLFAGAVMLGASYTYQKNEHVRVDLVYAHVSSRTRLFIDIFGLIAFLLPACLLFTWLSWETLFLPSWEISEQSSNSGGLPRYPVKFLLPLGFLLISLQGMSELIKRVAVLTGNYAEELLVTKYERPLQ